MTRNWRRTPSRRTVAAVVAAAFTATVIGYVGIGTQESAGRAGTGPGRHTGPVTEAEAFSRAAKTGEPVEVTSLRTPRSTTWARPDGLMAEHLYSSPVRAKVDGVWKAVDPDLRRTADGWEPKATNTRMVFSAGSGDHGDNRASRTEVRRVSLVEGAEAAAEASLPLVTLYVDGYTIQLTWPGPVPAPVIDGSRALYPEIFPGADLVLTAADDGFAQLVVLKNRQAAADPRAKTLSYGITSPDLNFRLDPVSDILTAENVYSDEVATSPTPLMWDSSGVPAVTDGTVGATAQPTEAEAPGPTETSGPEPEESPSPSEEAPVEADEQTDPYAEALPSATDGDYVAPSEPPLPSAPPEPTPAPSQSGPAATLGLPSLDGPSPDSHGELVDTDLSGANWTFTPDEAFLADPATTYPVFIDPSVKKHTQNWTTAYSRHPNATFYNGKGFNKGGTHEARVGFESDTWGTSRSYFNIAFDKDLKGAQITSAKLRLLETYAWSCSERSMSVHLTGPVNSHTNWKNAPKLHDGNKFATKSFAHGYKSGCRDAYETFDVRKAAQKQADQGKDSITFGLRARDEKSQYAWKKFQANGDNAPVLELVYNRKPSAPTSLDLGPDAKCTTTEPYVRMGSGSLTFTAKASDKDRNLDYLDFDLWPTTKLSTSGDLLGSTGKVSVGADTGTALRTTSAFPTSRLTNGTTYSWRVRAVDDAGASSAYSPLNTPCRFVLDTAAPKPPKVSSTDFPNADGDENGFGNGAEDANWSTKKFGTPGSFTVRALSSDTVRYEYGFNSASYPFSLARTAGTATTVSATIGNAKPPTAGPNVLYVRALDGAGNVSEPTKYFFYVSPRDQADAPGDFTGDKLPDLMVITENGNLSLYPSQATNNDLAKGSGDLDYSMSGAYRGNPDKDPQGDDLPPFVAAPSGHFKGALITHNGDIYGGDGLQDLVVRVGGKLWVYPGDGYGAVNIDNRREILLPPGAPSPADLTQIVAAGDATEDGLTDFFATVGDALWVFTGYNGASIDKATRLSSSAWTERDIVTAQDISGDGITDLVYRTDATGRLLLRKGIAASGGGVDLGSLASAANSAGGVDIEYGSVGWSSTSIPHLIGTPDANGDAIPDIWTVRSDGSVRFYAGGRAVLSGSGTEIIGTTSYWKTRIGIG
ncbi:MULTISPECIES: DNRLRE domain-containing protein [unclassified Streptomyces]|uniref:DNRLRE domain-containing protein n=1 Tax=unclassified Streptomyces TaxID=2593676 RepID=UPI000B858DA6|nr:MULTISPECIES: DNRLRE domain-containing protein [unclassified Streptomyces]MYZ36124.1 DNRLRE domain-containing protein [Streptomyces sp. SID4917]